MRIADAYCDCNEGHRPGFPWYYTSAMDDRGQKILLSGPYLNHPAARSHVREDCRWVADGLNDRRALWYSYGTAVSYHNDLPTARK